jgi:hypothetical protein
MMKGVLFDEPFECGIDYFTATKARTRSANSFVQFANRVVRTEERLGNEKRGWGMSGYKGFRCGGAETGERADGFILRLSSGLADELWKRAYHLADNCSRIDLQVTATIDEAPSTFIAREFKRMARWSNEVKARPVVSILRENRGPATVYSGKRVSDKFGRLYDKGAESGLAHYQNCVRFEVELKGEVARLASLQLFRSKRSRSLCYSGVRQFFEERGGASWPASDFLLHLEVNRSPSDAQQKLAWLRNSVRGTVEWLKARGLEAEVCDALNLRSEKQSGLTLVRRAS